MNILNHRRNVQANIMKSFGVDTPKDENGFEDEINPFELEAYKSNLTKAELEDFEKAQHNDGDLHPNGKWVWRASANGGKGDWRVAKKGDGKRTAPAAPKKDDKKEEDGETKEVAKFLDAIKSVNSKYTDESKIKAYKTDKGNWYVEYDGKKVGTYDGKQISEKTLKEKGWFVEEDKNNDSHLNDIKDISTEWLKRNIHVIPDHLKDAVKKELEKRDKDLQYYRKTGKVKIYEDEKKKFTKGNVVKINKKDWIVSKFDLETGKVSLFRENENGNKIRKFIYCNNVASMIAYEKENERITKRREAHNAFAYALGEARLKRQFGSKE